MLGNSRMFGVSIYPVKTVGTVRQDIDILTDQLPVAAGLTRVDFLTGEICLPDATFLAVGVVPKLDEPAGVQLTEQRASSDINSNSCSSP